MSLLLVESEVLEPRSDDVSMEHVVVESPVRRYLLSSRLRLIYSKSINQYWHKSSLLSLAKICSLLSSRMNSLPLFRSLKKDSIYFL